MALPARELQILRLQPDARERKKLTAGPDGRQPIEDHVRMQAATLTQLQVRANGAVRPDIAAAGNLGVRINYGCGVNLGRAHRLMPFYRKASPRSIARLTPVPPASTFFRWREQSIRRPLWRAMSKQLPRVFIL